MDQALVDRLAKAWNVESPKLASVLLAPGVQNLLQVVVGTLEQYPEAKAAVVKAVRQALEKPPQAD